MNTYDCFQQIEMRVGRIVAVDDFPQARKPAYKLHVDFGEQGLRQSSAQITDLYSKQDLQGRLVIAVTNLPPRKIAGFKSEVLILGVPDNCNRVVLLQPDKNAEPGVRVF